ncbi:MAG: transketolase C-terminal domain-containing protein [Bacteroidota bacterium]
MEIEEKGKRLIMDGSELIVESLARSGADVFIGYPITPANLLYSYSQKRFPSFFAAPDEISTLQWMCGFSTTGKFPVTATSFPGFALMLESVNMAYMMELPMLIILVQRLGPATGTATCGAQGDLTLLNGTISGGFSLPVISVSSMNDCWELSNKAMKMAIDIRTPVVLLTSKEEIMTLASFSISHLPEINFIERNFYSGNETFVPYKTNESLVPEFLPVGNSKHQVRFTASTHDPKGIIQNTSKEAIENTKRLEYKHRKNLEHHLYYEYDSQAGADTLLISYGITASASREAVKLLRKQGEKVSLLIPKTLLPVSPKYFEIIEKYKRVMIAEENLTGQYKNILFGEYGNKNVIGVNEIAEMITPEKIIDAVVSKKVVY